MSATPIDPDEVDPIPYDAGEGYDAGDMGPVIIPAGTDAILFAQMLVDLRDAGFPTDPTDPDGAGLAEVDC